MKYFYDTEFLEGTQKTIFGKTKPTIDLISIGIVAEDGRELYLVSKDFNLKEAWNRHDLKANKLYPTGPADIKVYWIRENVLKPIFKDWQKDSELNSMYDFTYKNFSRFLKCYGMPNKQIAHQLFNFVHADTIKKYDDGIAFSDEIVESTYRQKLSVDPIDFYGYYSAYDHVALCWLYGKMINLPKGFPMFTIDLKQMLDEKANARDWYYGRDCWSNVERMDNALSEKDRPATLEEKLKKIKSMIGYPKQENAHNALDDAKWNKKLYEFISML